MADRTKNGSHDRHGGETTATTPLLSRETPNADSGYEARNIISTQDVDEEWDAKENSQNPRNWSRSFKWTTVILVSFIEFLTTMPNFMYAPNITDAQQDLNSSDNTLATFSLTIYVLGFGLGPLLFAPLSEVYGRAFVYRSCVAVFLVMTLGCGLSQSIEMLVAFRFLAGSFGAAPVAVGGAVVGDLFQVKERGTAMSIYQAGQIISAVVGPPVGGLIGSYLVWRWVFWIVCILAAFALLCTIFILKETHAPTLKRSTYGTDGPGKFKGAGETENCGILATLRLALARPLQLLLKSPAVLAGCILIFVVIGLLNVFLTEISRTVQQVYHVTPGQSGVMYLGLALGFVAASVLFGVTNDRIMHGLARRHRAETQPEYRLPATVVAMAIIAIGTLWYGWTLQYKMQVIIPIIGSGLAGLGITTVQLSITTYMVDSFDKFSASALAAVTMARSIGGAVIPLLGPSIYKELDQGWGNSIFALIALQCNSHPNVHTWSPMEGDVLYGRPIVCMVYVKLLHEQQGTMRRYAISKSARQCSSFRVGSAAKLCVSGVTNRSLRCKALEHTNGYWNGRR